MIPNTKSASIHTKFKHKLRWFLGHPLFLIFSQKKKEVGKLK